MLKTEFTGQFKKADIEKIQRGISNRQSFPKYFGQLCLLSLSQENDNINT